MSDPVLTPQQSNAVFANTGSLLVSAAAGSGKTMVLVSRIMNKICSGIDANDITDFLIITYTKAAANELRAKILKAINEKIAEKPENRHLRRQAILCLNANISTIHSFCTQLLRENAGILGISPDFRVAEEDETDLIKNDILDRVIESKYQTIENDENFKALSQLMTEMRGDDRINEAVLDAYKKLQSHIDPESWMCNQENALCLEDVTDAGQTMWGMNILNDLRETALYWIDKMTEAYDSMESDPEMLKDLGANFSATIISLHTLYDAFESGWDAVRNCIELNFPRAGKISKYPMLKKLRQDCKDRFKKEAEMFDCTSEELIEDMKASAKQVKGLYSLIREFDKQYSAEKVKRGIIDFSDEEHLALKLLYDFETHEPTQIAHEVSARFKEIFVDEYQDVNDIQEIIFRSVSQNGDNIFMVGDVKQSIYKFRMAEPRIFLKKYRDFPDYTPDIDEPSKIILPNNFRSSTKIIDAVNYVFGNLMSKELGELDYTEKESLKRLEEDDACEPVEFDVLTFDKDEIEQIPAESEFVADRIEEIVRSGMMIPSSDGMRKVGYGDIAILLRSMKGTAWQFAYALEKRGIPVDLPADDSFFKSYEVSTILSLIAVIDNPRQDIPLISVLRSCIFGFTANGLTDIRTCDKKVSMYDALLKRAETDKKCADFISEIEFYRTQAAFLPANELLWLIYSRTGMIEVMTAVKEGSRDNLVMLADMARRYEANGFRGLFRFAVYVRKLMESDKDPDREFKQSGNGVVIMSVHKSKGLEFPVVFLCALSKKFNTTDMSKNVLFHKSLGVGLYMKDTKRRIKYPTLARYAIAKNIRREALSEEIRVLYVAMTRAKDKLILVNSTIKPKFDKLWPYGKYPADSAALEGMNNFSDWLTETALTRSESIALYMPDEIMYNVDTKYPWDMHFIEYKPHDSSATNVKSPVNDACETFDVQKILDSLAFKYTHSAQDIPSKLTATELKGRVSDGELSEDAEPMIHTSRKLRKPEFILSEKPMTGAERGIAMHHVMQFIDYAKCVTLDGIHEEIDRLTERRFISKREADSIDTAKILRFFKSPLGQKILASDNVNREYKFSLLVPANELINSEESDEILFQGVIDCWIEEPDGITVLDFKTDYVDGENFKAKICEYAPQIKSYAYALSRITGKEIKSAILYFFHNEKAVEILAKKDKK